jgi:hypothetical protein
VLKQVPSRVDLVLKVLPLNYGESQLILRQFQDHPSDLGPELVSHQVDDDLVDSVAQVLFQSVLLEVHIVGVLAIQELVESGAEDVLLGAVHEP